MTAPKETELCTAEQREEEEASEINKQRGRL